jgi:hypothetical protein
VGFIVEKVALRQVFSEYFGLPANSHSTGCSTITIVYHLGLVQKARQWPQYQVNSVSTHDEEDVAVILKGSLDFVVCSFFNTLISYC